MNAAYYSGNRSFDVRGCNVVPPGPGELRIDVAYSGICGTDLHIFHGAMDQRVHIPQVIGHEMSGTVVELGEGVTDIKIGTHVVVRPLDNSLETAADRGFSHICRHLKFMGVDSPGSLQTSWTVPAFTVHQLPDHIDLREGALVEPLAVACHDVRRGAVQAGELVVVLGAGPIGVLIALVARQAGARVVIAEINPFRLQFAKSLGFEVLNPVESNLLEWVRRHSGDSGADAVFEVSGAQSALLSATELLAIRGRLILVAIYSTPAQMNLFHFFWKELQLIGARVYEREDFERAISLLETRSLPIESMITDVFRLEDISQAFARLETDTAAMKILIDCQS